MFFRVIDKVNTTAEDKINSVKQIAYSKILRYPMSTNAIQLDQYFTKKYKKNLKQICKEILLLKTYIYTGADEQTIIIKFKDPQADNIASFITYGNSEIPGCDILKFVFDQNY